MIDTVNEPKRQLKITQLLTLVFPIICKINKNHILKMNFPFSEYIYLVIKFRITILILAHCTEVTLIITIKIVFSS